MSDYFRSFVARIHESYEAKDGYAKGVQRMGDMAKAEEAIRLGNTRAQAMRELPPRECSDAADRMKAGGALLPLTRWLLGLRQNVHFLEGATAVIMAPAGVGKTVSCCRLGLEEAASGASVRYVCAYSDGWLQSARRGDVEVCDLFFADESRRALGHGSWVQEAFKEVINTRFSSRRRTVLCFTGTVAEFTHGFGPEVWDRMAPDLRYTVDSESHRWEAT